jgi:hypothetical protein
MAVNCDPNALAEAAKSFGGLSQLQCWQLMAYCTAVKAGGSTDPAVLLTASKAWQGVSEGDLKRIIIDRLCALLP